MDPTEHKTLRFCSSGCQRKLTHSISLQMVQIHDTRSNNQSLLHSFIIQIHNSFFIHKFNAINLNSVVVNFEPQDECNKYFTSAKTEMPYED
jgi:hypothetical protein